MSAAPTLTRIEARGYVIPTDAPEADGTIAWDRTHLTVVEAEAGGRTGLGYTYGASMVPALVREVLAPRLRGAPAFAIPAHWEAMRAAVRNIGRPGIAATAISAVDTALWDLKARLLGLPLVDLLGARREAVPVYGSGGFTSYSDARTIAQFADWLDRLGCREVKMKVGADPPRDPGRIAAVRAALPQAGLMIDANGALDRKQALVLAEAAAPLGVTWFEEPVSSDDLDGLRLLRDRAPPGMEIAAGEYAYDVEDVRRLATAGAIDVMQLDATRCCGITGFLEAAAVAAAHHLPISAHTAPALHLHVCCAAPRLRHVEWFHDHVRIEAMLFDGAPTPVDGRIAPDRTRPGTGLVFKRADAEGFAA